VGDLERSPFLGSLFEDFVATEIFKSQAVRGMPKELYYFRHQQGLEADFLVPRTPSVAGRSEIREDCLAAALDFS
jgi:predicted AAA+ superfamily ATPase